MADLASSIRSVPDFPKPGIVFRDVTTLLKDAAAFRSAVDQFAARYENRKIDKVAGIESRGFILGAALAYRIGAGFILIRKPGKLPAAKLRQDYSLEYGTDAVEIHTDALRAGERILLHDDLLATGGTTAASASLIEKLGGQIIECSFLIELTFLRGREKLKGREVFSLIQYEHE